MKSSAADAAIAANLEVLKEDLELSLNRVTEALEAAKDGRRNEAMGTLSITDRAIRSAPGLLDAMIAIHYRAEPQR